MLKLAGQLAAFALFALAVGYFSASPQYNYMAADKALIKMNFSHAGQPTQACRKVTQAELDQLAPNMRKPMDCPRERVALLVEVKINGESKFKRAVPPSGIARDGAATVYEKFELAEGTYAVSVAMRDSRREQGYDYIMQKEVSIEAGQVLVIDFEAETGGFKFL